MVLVTGFPKLLARRMAEALWPRGSVTLLAQERHEDDAAAFATSPVSTRASRSVAANAAASSSCRSWASSVTALAARAPRASCARAAWGSP